MRIGVLLYRQLVRPKMDLLYPNWRFTARTQIW